MGLTDDCKRPALGCWLIETAQGAEFLRCTAAIVMARRGGAAVVSPAADMHCATTARDAPAGVGVGH